MRREYAAFFLINEGGYMNEVDEYLLENHVQADEDGKWICENTDDDELKRFTLLLTSEKDIERACLKELILGSDDLHAWIDCLIDQDEQGMKSSSKILKQLSRVNTIEALNNKLGCLEIE